MEEATERLDLEPLYARLLLPADAGLPPLAAAHRKSCGAPIPEKRSRARAAGGGADSAGAMSLAGGRAPRKTAGNRLSGLLEAEEEDEFYQTTYGGFTEARAGRRKREGRKRSPAGKTWTKRKGAGRAVYGELRLLTECGGGRDAVCLCVGFAVVLSCCRVSTERDPFRNRKLAPRFSAFKSLCTIFLDGSLLAVLRESPFISTVETKLKFLIKFSFFSISDL